MIQEISIKRRSCFTLGWKTSFKFKGTRLSINASINGHEQRPGIPMLNSGNGFEQANTVYPYGCRLVFRL